MTAPGDLPPGHALLVVRAWVGEPGHPGLSARVWSTPDVGTAEPVSAVVRSADEVLDAVREWLSHLPATDL